MTRAEWRVLSIESGVSFSGISKVAYGVVKNPHYRTLADISTGLDRMARRARNHAAVVERRRQREAAMGLADHAE